MLGVKDILEGVFVTIKSKRRREGVDIIILWNQEMSTGVSPRLCGPPTKYFYTGDLIYEFWDRNLGS